MSPEKLQDKISGPRNIEAYKKLEFEKRRNGGYILLLRDFARSPIRDIEGFSRNIVRLNEDVSQLVLKKYSLCLITYEAPPGNYSIKDFSQVVYTMGDHEGTLQVD